MGSSLKVGGVKGILVGLKEPKGIIFVALEAAMCGLCIMLFEWDVGDI